MNLTEAVLIYSFLRRMATPTYEWTNLNEESIMDKLVSNLKIDESKTAAVAALILFVEDAASMNTGNVVGAGDSGEAIVRNDSKHKRNVRKLSREMQGRGILATEERPRVPRGDLGAVKTNIDDSHINPARPRGGPEHSPAKAASDAARSGRSTPGNEPGYGATKQNGLRTKTPVSNKKAGAHNPQSVSG